MTQQARILLTEFVTHDVRRFIVTKPDGFHFEPGQGVEIAIDREGLRDRRRPFTPTSHPDDEVLEFTIKKYPEREGVTEELHRCEPGNTLLLGESASGNLTYRGRGTFVAGGTGITPMLAIIRKLARDGNLEGHTLVFSNDTPADVICEKELREAFGKRAHFTCTRESAPGYDSRRVDRDYLEKIVEDEQQYFYVCGPPDFVEDVNEALQALDIEPDRLIHED